MWRRLLMLLAALAVSHGVAGAQELPIGPPPRVRPLAKAFQLQGAGSCAAAACHNGDGRTGSRGHEYALALERDPSGQHTKDRHAEAYEVLFSPRSRSIEQKLHGTKNPRPETDALCLRCHVHPGFDRQPVRRVDGVAQFRLEDGVSCEACHGPAERWLAPHFRAGWNEQPAAVRLAQGQTDTRSLPGRIQVCVDCHVGAADMEVNHDLIAAGHPRLHFEFHGFHTLLHKHWDPAVDSAPDFDARAWALGQLIAACADLRLLAFRADAANDRPWPEFAAHDCYACHHDLQGKSWRQQQGRPGTMPMNRWYTAELPHALAVLGAGADGKLHANLTLLRKAMTAPRPDRKTVVAQARDGVALLDALVARLDAAPIDALRQPAGADAPPTSWDTAAQRYLALTALRRPGPQLALPRLRALLQFPAGYDSPADFDPAALRKALDAYNKTGPEHQGEIPSEKR